MLSFKELIQLLLIVVVIGLPPYLIGLKMFQGLNPAILIGLSIVYWGGTIYTQQVVPFILILFILFQDRRNKGPWRIMRLIQKERFRFKDFISISVLTILCSSYWNN